MMGPMPTPSPTLPLATHPHFLALEEQGAGAWQARLPYCDGQDGVVGTSVECHIHGLDVVQAIGVQFLLGQTEGLAVRPLRAMAAPRNS